MTTATFDTLAFSKRMKNVGFTEKQAEELAKDFVGIFENQLVTKQDIKNLTNSVRLEMKSLEYRLTLRIGSMIALAVVAVPFVLKLVNLV